MTYFGKGVINSICFDPCNLSAGNVDQKMNAGDRPNLYNMAAEQCCTVGGLAQLGQPLEVACHRSGPSSPLELFQSRPTQTTLQIWPEYKQVHLFVNRGDIFRRRKC